ncbi:hypothetical protein HOY82DRAFT_645858, partial [Tuber indicum]
GGVWVSVSVCVPGPVTTLIPVAPISRKETKELHKYGGRDWQDRPGCKQLRDRIDGSWGSSLGPRSMQTTFQPPSLLESSFTKINQTCKRLHYIEKERRADHEDKYQNGQNKRGGRKKHTNQMGLDHPPLHDHPRLRLTPPFIYIQFLSHHRPFLLQLELVKMGYRTALHHQQ